MKKDWRKLTTVLGLTLAWLVLAGCGESRSPFVGTYQSVEPFAGKGHIRLQLKEDGECTWKLGEAESLKFKWRVNKGQIWIYTKEGAILIVTPGNDGKILSVDMTGDWHPGCPPGSCVTFKRVPEGG